MFICFQDKALKDPKVLPELILIITVYEVSCLARYYVYDKIKDQLNISSKQVLGYYINISIVRFKVTQYSVT